MAREKERQNLSLEERRARQKKQDQLKQIAVRKMGRKLNALFRLVAIAGIAAALFLLTRDIFPDDKWNQSGYSAIKDVILTGRAWEKVSSVQEPYRKMVAGPAATVIALVPLLLATILGVYVVDWVKPMGRAPHVISATFAILLAVFLTVMAKADMWPGVKGNPIAVEILALFAMSVGSILATPGSNKRLTAAETPPDTDTAAQPASAEETSGETDKADGGADEQATAEEHAEEKPAAETQPENDAGETSGGETAEEARQNGEPTAPEHLETADGEPQGETG
ncbi:MAG: hypothetical protein JW909_12540 [Planctomycetes bacterium]|nr:hypothetical protein [Planctomycetota bacterium]